MRSLKHCEAFALAFALIASAVFPGCTKKDEKAVQTPPAARSTPVNQLAAQPHIDAAKALADAGNYNGAVDEYSAALDAMRLQTQMTQHDSPQADVLFHRGLAYLQMGFPDTAAADFTEVLRLCPGDGPAFAKRGEAYTKLGDYYKAVRDCTDAIRRVPEDANAYRYRGQAYLHRGQFDRAAIDLEQAVALDSSLQPEVRPMLARAYRVWGERLAKDDPAAAEAKLAKARELDPEYAATVANASTGASSEAIKLTAAKQIIDESREQYEHGFALEREGRYDEALTAFTAAIDARHGYTEAYMRRAETLMALRFPDTAVKDIEQAIRYGGDSVEAYRLEAKAFLALKNQHRAVLTATNALHVDPTDAASHAIRGTAYVELGEWDRAIIDLEEAIRRDPALTPTLTPVLERAYELRSAAQASAAASQAAAAT